MRKKIILLFLALILPGLVFIFLKRFGKNEFAIPIYFENNVDSVNTACGTHFTRPYHVPDSVLEKTGWLTGRPALFVLDTLTKSNSEFRRLQDEFDATAYQVIGINAAKFGETIFKHWGACVFMIRNSSNVVLMDQEKRIRGYYLIGSREEADRLILEMEILLKKF